MMWRKTGKGGKKEGRRRRDKKRDGWREKRADRKKEASECRPGDASVVFSEGKEVLV